MRLSLLAVGRLKDGPERILVDDYLSRARSGGRSLGLRGPEEIEVASGGGPEAEGVRLLARLPQTGRIIRLDEEGDNPGSEALARNLGRWRDEGEPGICFLIGGAAGYSRDVRARAPVSLAFGRQTWPHRLVRVMLAEQIYRAVTILSNTPYHKA